MDTDSPKQKLFIVEDDAELAEMLTVYFRGQGYEVEGALKGKTAVAMMTENPPDLALLDIRLDDIDGYEVCRQLRQSRRTQNLPVIFLTERSKKEDKLNGLELGAVDYITKPFVMRELALRVRNALRRTSFKTLYNPVSNLPEGTLVQEQISARLSAGNWGAVLVRVQNLPQFRDQYGFIAADDVLRAVTLLLNKTIRDGGIPDDFLGQLTSNEFLILTTAERCASLARQCQQRLEPAVPYFYPALERPRLHKLPDSERLALDCVAVSAREHRAGSVADFLDLLNNRSTAA